MIKSEGMSNQEIGVRGTEMNTDEMLYANVTDDDYTPLARPPLKDETETPLYQALIKDMKKIEELKEGRKRPIDLC